MIINEKNTKIPELNILSFSEFIKNENKNNQEEIPQLNKNLNRIFSLQNILFENNKEQNLIPEADSRYEKINENTSYFNCFDNNENHLSNKEDENLSFLSKNNEIEKCNTKTLADVLNNDNNSFISQKSKKNQRILVKSSDKFISIGNQENENVNILNDSKYFTLESKIILNLCFIDLENYKESLNKENNNLSYLSHEIKYNLGEKKFNYNKNNLDLESTHKFVKKRKKILIEFLQIKYKKNYRKYYIKYFNYKKKSIKNKKKILDLEINNKSKEKNLYNNIININFNNYDENKKKLKKYSGELVEQGDISNINEDTILNNKNEKFENKNDNKNKKILFDVILNSIISSNKKYSNLNVN